MDKKSFSELCNKSHSVGKAAGQTRAHTNTHLWWSQVTRLPKASKRTFAKGVWCRVVIVKQATALANQEWKMSSQFQGRPPSPGEFGTGCPLGETPRKGNKKGAKGTRSLVMGEDEQRVTGKREQLFRNSSNQSEAS